ncbi:DUF5658 family protein [Novosphingobium sp. KACC 22771]|uniref:DUF5658 family protein n=1 Tax=Novosphingobium sp. KACC 22771 TaxID=3025670 RepID=UPI002366E6FB|nr:DUF5658 family protein [Novosphingobium sp. KACC 22771]WDF71477.1 DUF5658 family protein [Novosphingobium sp. KACC 22771]
MHLVLYLLAALFLALNGADCYLTRACILSGRGREANPLAAWLMARLGINAVLGAKLAIMTAIALWLVFVSGPTAPLAAVLTLLAMNAFYVWVVRNNYRVLHP